jgi:hypothetical protein
MIAASVWRVDWRKLDVVKSGGALGREALDDGNLIQTITRANASLGVPAAPDEETPR